MLKACLLSCLSGSWQPYFPPLPQSPSSLLLVSWTIWYASPGHFGCYSSYLAFKTLLLCRFCSQLPQVSFSHPTCLSLLSLIFVWETASPRLAWLFCLSSLSVWDCKVHATTSMPYSENPFHSIIDQLLNSCPISLLKYKLQDENWLPCICSSPRTARSRCLVETATNDVCWLYVCYFVFSICSPIQPNGCLKPYGGFHMET